MTGECVQKITICGVNTGNKTAAAPIEANPLSERHLLRAAGSGAGTIAHLLARTAFFPDAEKESRRKCSYRDTVPLRSNGNFLIKENFSIAKCDGVAFLCDTAFSYTTVDVQMCLLGYSLGAAFSKL